MIPLVKDTVAFVVTKGGYDISEVLNSLSGFKEVRVWDNSQPADLKVYGRYVKMYQAVYLDKLPKNSIVYTQDDDVIVSDHQAILNAYEPDTIVCNMPPEFQKVYAHIGLGLVGFGACFDYQCTKVFNHYRGPGDVIFLNECDRLLTGLNKLKYVDVPKRNMEYATAPDRMYHRRNHEADFKEILRRIQTQNSSVLRICNDRHNLPDV